MKKSKKGVKLPFKRLCKDYIFCGILILILANALFYALSHVEGSSNYGDDPNYLWLASTVIHGNFQINPGYIFSVRLMSFLPIAVIYFFLGVNNFTSTLWNIISYLGIIVVAFLVVRLFYDNQSALLSAFLASIFPIVTQFAVNIGEDVPLTFVCSLAVLLFLYAERFGNRWYYFASGVMLVFAWLISYESAVTIAFVLLYALVQVLRKKIKVETANSMFFVYGIALAFIPVFIFSYINVGVSLVTITTNLRFYSGVGARVNGLPTIPSSETDLSFYPNTMFAYRLLAVLQNSGDVIAAIQNAFNVVFNKDNLAPYGLYFYLLIPALAAVLLSKKKAYFLVAWFAFVWLMLEFGPMHVSLNLNPLSVTYLLAHRLERFMMVLSVPLCGIIGVGLSKLLSFKSNYKLVLGAVIFASILAALYVNGALISTFWYYWQYYPESLTLQAANYLRPYVFNSSIYVGAIANGSGVSFAGSNLPSYMGYPSDPRFFVVNVNSTCSLFQNNSYVVWSGQAPCGRFRNVLNITVPQGIPPEIISGENHNLMLLPTNVYYAT